MSCRHSLANGTCTVCYPATGTYEPDGPGDSMDGPGAVPAKPIAILDARIEELETRVAELIEERDAAVAARATHEQTASCAMAKMRADKAALRSRVAGLELALAAKGGEL